MPYKEPEPGDSNVICYDMSINCIKACPELYYCSYPGYSNQGQRYKKDVLQENNWTIKESAKKVANEIAKDGKGGLLWLVGGVIALLTLG